MTNDAKQMTNDLMTKKSALEGSRTPNLLIRSQVLYPLSYERQRVRS